MNESSLSYRRPAESSLAKREKRRDYALYLFIFLLLAAVVVASLKVIDLNKKIELVDEGIYRSEEQMINGGKRFLDYFLSLNSATVRHDLFAAQQMMIDEEMKEKRLDYLKKTDFIRETERSMMKSSIDWKKSSVSVVEKNGEQLTVDYRCFLVINNKDEVALNIILVINPVKKTDGNPDGVGVMSFTDIAINPFKETQ